MQLWSESQNGLSILSLLNEYKFYSFISNRNVINKLQQEEEDKIPKAEEDAQSNASPRHATPVSDAPSKGKGKGSDPKLV